MGELVFKKEIVQFIFAGLMVITGFLSIKWFGFILTYNEHQGFENGVFGYPTPFNYAIFYLLYWIIAFIGSILVISFRNTGWYLINIVALLAFIYLFLAVSLSLYSKTQIDYILCILLIFAFLLLYFFNNKKFTLYFSLKNNVSSLIINGIGVMVLGFIAIFLFGFYELI